MKQQIDEVKAKGVNTEGHVQSKGERRQRSVGLVRLSVGHRPAPEVVRQKVTERGSAEDVGVLQHRRQVVVHKVAAEGVEEDQGGEEARKEVHREIGAEEGEEEEEEGRGQVLVVVVMRMMMMKK